MRFGLLLKPGVLCQRLAEQALQRRRLRKLRHTAAHRLYLGHIDSLELLEAARPLGISVVYDIGANVGTWTLLAKAVIPQCSIEAFEPLPQHVVTFQQKVWGVGGVRLHCVALGSQNRSAA